MSVTFGSSLIINLLSISMMIRNRDQGEGVGFGFNSATKHENNYLNNKKLVQTHIFNGNPVINLKNVHLMGRNKCNTIIYITTKSQERRC